MLQINLSIYLSTYVFQFILIQPESHFSIIFINLFITSP